jgi:hypothetical protein
MSPVHFLLSSSKDRSTLGQILVWSVDRVAHLAQRMVAAHRRTRGLHNTFLPASRFSSSTANSTSTPQPTHTPISAGESGCT